MFKIFMQSKIKFYQRRDKTLFVKKIVIEDSFYINFLLVS